jgi:hypothetical protein
MPRLRRFWDAQRNGVHAAAKVPGFIAHQPLPPVFWVYVKHGNAYAAQIGDDAGFFKLAGLKQAHQPAFVADRFRPAESVPNRPFAFPAD